VEEELRVCVVIPTYNNQGTLESVVRGALRHGLPLIVVDDGSTDSTAAILEYLDEEIVVLTHASNRGKGAALLTGFHGAAQRGWTHAITLDSDGQHKPEDIPTFIDALRAAPRALLLGTRDLVAAGAGPGSRFGNAMSSFWVWVETGCRLADTQTGFRSYPIEPILALELRGRGFSFEFEVLVKASWCGTELRSVPVQVEYLPAGERVSHLRPVVDFLRIGWLNTKLTTARLCLPPLFLSLYCQREFRSLELRAKLKQGLITLVYEEPGSRKRMVGSVGLGLFMGIAPFWGFQIALTLLLAHLLKASKTIAVLASNISMPVMIPPIVYASLLLGRWLLGTEQASLTTLELTQPDLPAWIVGSFALAILVALAGSALTWLGLTLFGIGERRESTS
jgi:glycosyltransferase involved in cell wall biosynthesis